MPPDSTGVVADDVTAESATGKGQAGGAMSKEAIISLSVTLSVLFLLLIGVAVVLVRLNKQKKVLLPPQSRRDRRGKTSGVERSSSAERGNSIERSHSLKSSHATEQRSQAPHRKHSKSSEGDPDEPRMTVNVSNELSSAGGPIICTSPVPPAPMNPPPAPARAPQICRRTCASKKLRRSISSSGGGGSGSSGGGTVELQTGFSLHRQLLAAPPPPLDASSPRRRCRSADAPAEQQQ